MIPDCLNIAFRKEEIATKNSAKPVSLGNLGN